MPLRKGRRFPVSGTAFFRARISCGGGFPGAADYIPPDIQDRKYYIFPSFAAENSGGKKLVEMAKSITFILLPDVYSAMNRSIENSPPPWFGGGLCGVQDVFRPDRRVVCP